MADKEAKITFRAETAEFRSQIKAANSQMQSLRSEMKLNESQFKNSGDRIDYLEKKSQLLTSQLASNRDKQTALNAELQVAASYYGQDSAQVARLEKQLNYTKAQEEQLKSQLSEVNTELSQNATATGKLTNTISDQEVALDRLKAEYVEAVLAYGENSDEAQELAGEISDLSRKLGENRTALANAEDAADQLDESLDDAGDAAEETGGKFDALKVAAGNLIADGLQAIANAAKDVVSETLEVGQTFEDSMNKVAALSGATGDDLERLKKTAQDLGAATVYSSSEAADALGYMALAGWNVDQSIEGLPGVLNLAAASGMDLAQASDMVTDYLSAFGLEASDSAYFADLLAYAQANANTTTEALGEAYKNCAANMNASGQDIETTTALLSMMANQGLKGSEAGTALTAVMRDMTAKMKDGKIAIGDTSIEVMDANGNYRDMTDILLDVEGAVDGMGDAERATALQSTFTSDSIKGLNLMLNAGIGEAQAFEDELRGSGVTAEGLQQSMADAGMSLEDMRAAFERAGISGEDFEDALQRSRGDAGLFVDTLNEWVEPGNNASDILGELGYSLEDLQGAMDSSTGTAEQMSNVMTDSLSGDMQDLEGSIELVQLSLYDKLEPALRDGVGVLTSFVDVIGWVVDNGETVVSVLGAMAAGVGTYVAYTTAINVAKNGWMALSVVQKASAAAQWALNAAMEANPIGIVIGLIAALVAGLVLLWQNNEDFRNAVTPIWEGIKSVVAGVVDWFTGTALPAIQGFIDMVVQFFQQLWEFLEPIWENIRGVVETVISFIVAFVRTYLQALFTFWSTIFNAIWTVATTIWNGIRNTISTVINAVSTVISSVINAISATWSAVWNVVWTVATTIWNGIRNTIATAINAVSTVVSSVINAISSTVSSVFNAVWSTVTNIWNGIRNTISTAINGAQTAVSGVVNGISSTVSSVFNGVKSTVTSIWNGIKDAIMNPINTARDTVRGAIDTIKNIINGAHLELPHFKLPHFRIDGGELPWGIGGKGRAPTVAIDWYARGGILTSPTIFGWNGSSFLGGGEAGREAVLPIETLQAYIDAAFQRNLGGTHGIDRVAAEVAALRRELPRTIADNAPDSYPGDRSFRTALRKVGVDV